MHTLLPVQEVPAAAVKNGSYEGEIMRLEPVVLHTKELTSSWVEFPETLFHNDGQVLIQHPRSSATLRGDRHMYGWNGVPTRRRALRRIPYYQ
jgi:hypothetical protein